MKRTDIIIGGHYLRGGQHVQVDQILGSKVKCGMYIIPINMLEPMPLAPKILEKNGFGKLVTYGTEKWIYGDVKMNIYSSNGCWRFCADTKRNEDSVVYIHFVHELQQALRTCKVDLDIVL